MRATQLLPIALLACDGGDRPALGDSTCELAAATSGELEWTASDAPACVSPAASRGLTMAFHDIGSAIITFTVELDDVAPGQLGGFPGRIELVRTDGQTWTTPMTCGVTLIRNDFLEEDGFTLYYEVEGDGVCGDLAVRPGDLEPAVVEPFAFRYPAQWSR